MSQRMIDNLFMKFATFYGQQFLSKWAGIDIQMVKNESEDALSIYNEKTILIALNTCRENNQYPPSLPEFIQLCKQWRFVEPVAKLEHKPAEFKKENLDKLAELKQMIKSKMVVEND